MAKNRKSKLSVSPVPEKECGVFLPLPFDLAKKFPPKMEDSSEPHFTLLYAGKLSPCGYRNFVDIVRRCARNIAPFTADLAAYSAFLNKQKQKIPHMRPSPRVCLHMARIHGLIRRELEKEGIKLSHSYGPETKASAPYELRYKAHATLGYMDNARELYRGPKPIGSWRATEIECWGYERYRIPLGRTRGDQPTGLFRGYTLGKYPLALRDERTKSAILAVLKKLKIRIANCRKMSGMSESRSRLDSNAPSTGLGLERSDLLIRDVLRVDENTIAGTGPARGVVGIDGTLQYLEFLKGEEKKEARKRRKRSKGRGNA